MNTNGAESETVVLGFSELDAEIKTHLPLYAEPSFVRIFDESHLETWGPRDPSVVFMRAHLRAETYYPKEWMCEVSGVMKTDVDPRIKKIASLYMSDYVPEQHIDIEEWKKDVDASFRRTGSPYTYGKSVHIDNGSAGYIIGGDCSTKHGSLYYGPEQHIDIAKGEGHVKLLQIIPTLPNVSFMTLAEQAVAGVMANRIASSDTSLAVNFMEVGVVFGLSFKLAGLALQEKNPKLSIWMTKISQVTTASAIVLSLVEHLPPVMGWIAGPISFLIIAASVAYS
ncbi:hypothetical protein ACS0TY_009798 [Phlomoides rotata]